MGLKFDGTIHLGHVLTTGAMIVAVALAWGDLRQNDALLDQRMTVLETTVQAMANQNTRITVLEERSMQLSTVPQLLNDIKSRLERIDAQ